MYERIKNMQTWEIIGAISSALSLIFAVYVHFRSKNEKLAEKAKMEIYKERLRSFQHNLTSVMYSIDAIVQLSKQDTATVEMLQNLARISRGQLFATLQQLEKDRGMLKNWRYGQMIESVDDIKETKEAPEK